MEAFSDGVFAIAITLRILDIAVAAGSEVDLLRALGDQWPSDPGDSSGFCGSVEVLRSACGGCPWGVAGSFGAGSRAGVVAAVARPPGQALACPCCRLAPGPEAPGQGMGPMMLRAKRLRRIVGVPLTGRGPGVGSGAAATTPATGAEPLPGQPDRLVRSHRLHPARSRADLVSVGSWTVIPPQHRPVIAARAAPATRTHRPGAAAAKPQHQPVLSELHAGHPRPGKVQHLVECRCDAHVTDPSLDRLRQPRT